MKHKGLVSRRNEFVRVEIPSPEPKIGRAILDGAARRESLGYWREHGDAVDALIHADTFEEQGVELQVPNGKICAIGIRRTVAAKNGHIVGKPKTVKILTRAARSSFEKQVHHRLPLVIVNNKVHEFTEKDIIQTKKAIQRELF